MRYPDIDLGDQMTQLIMAQRGYQANLQTIDRATKSLPGRPAAREGLIMTSPIGGIVRTRRPVRPGARGVGADMSVGDHDRRPPATPGAGGSDFASVLASSLDKLQATQSNADTLAVQAATGDLKDVHDYMIASNEASLATADGRDPQEQGR